LGPAVRVSLVIDGSGRATSARDDEARDRRIEEQARREGIDLDLIAEEGLSDERVETARAHARTRAHAGNQYEQGNGQERLHDRARKLWLRSSGFALTRPMRYLRHAALDTRRQ